VAVAALCRRAFCSASTSAGGQPTLSQLCNQSRTAGDLAGSSMIVTASIWSVQRCNRVLAALDVGRNRIWLTSTQFGIVACPNLVMARHATQ
jgi:hypothetical protein